MSEDKADKSARVIVWPESAVPMDISGNASATSFITNFMNSNDLLVLGTLRHDDAGKLYNSMMVLDSRGKMVAAYDKHHLVAIWRIFAVF